MPQKKGFQQLILDHLLANIGRTLEAENLQEISGWAADWVRSVRELRDEQGYQILSHKDRADLKPGQYLLETAKRKPAFQRGVSEEMRVLAYERNDYTCYMCGVAAGDTDEYFPGRTIRLILGHILDKSKGGSDIPSNLRAVCMNCSEGLQNTAPQKPNRIRLLSQIRRATIEDQEAVLSWLLKKYKHKKAPK